MSNRRCKVSPAVCYAGKGRASLMFFCLLAEGKPGGKAWWLGPRFMLACRIGGELQKCRPTPAAKGERGSCSLARSSGARVLYPRNVFCSRQFRTVATTVPAGPGAYVCRNVQALPRAKTPASARQATLTRCGCFDLHLRLQCVVPALWRLPQPADAAAIVF